MLEHPAVGAQVNRPGQKAVRPDRRAGFQHDRPGLRVGHDVLAELRPRAQKHAGGHFAIRTPGNPIGQMLADRRHVVANDVVRIFEQRQHACGRRQAEPGKVLQRPVQRKAQAARRRSRLDSVRSTRAARLRRRERDGQDLARANHSRPSAVHHAGQLGGRRAGGNQPGIDPQHGLAGRQLARSVEQGNLGEVRRHDLAQMRPQADLDPRPSPATRSIKRRLPQLIANAGRPSATGSKSATCSSSKTTTRMRDPTRHRAQAGPC